LKNKLIDLKGKEIISLTLYIYNYKIAKDSIVMGIIQDRKLKMKYSVERLERH